MDVELTQASALEYKRISSNIMSPSEAAYYLRGGQFPLRSFVSMLRGMYPNTDLQERLVAGLSQELPESAKQSVQRRVRNWLSGQNTPTNREDIFRIAFTLGLSEEEANLLLGFCTDYGIHYRDGHDVVYAWFLRTGRTYSEAKNFFASLPPISMTAERPSTGTDCLTRELRYDFLRPTTPEALRECYICNLKKFGHMHFRAYKYFCSYLNQLIHPMTAWGGDEPTYSVETVMELYLSLNMRSGKKRVQYDLVQRLIRRDWPNSTALKNIRCCKEDVPRKLLLLLYVITENLLDNDVEYPEYSSLQDRLDDHWWALNSILLDCGMPLLDPRNPTDWLVLYAISAGEDEPMSERMAQTIEELFKEEQ